MLSNSLATGPVWMQSIPWITMRTWGVPYLKGFYLANGFSGYGFQQGLAIWRCISELILMCVLPWT